MTRFVRKQWMTNRVIRRVVSRLHPKLHPGAPAMSFQMDGGCVLCRISTWMMKPILGELRDAYADRSTIPLSEETDTHRAVVMSATVKRQIEALDPEKQALVKEAMDKIARKA